jgi:hypothetical protein
MKTNALLISLIILAGCNSNKQGNIIGFRQNIHHDDFEYSVSDYSVTKLLTDSDDTLRARGIFYVVSFKVENKAMRVGHRWNNSIAYITDNSGNLYENDQDAQRFYAKSHPFMLNDTYNTCAGTSDSTILVFDLPVDIREPYLKVRGEIMMGDIFDRGRFRKLKVRLF